MSPDGTPVWKPSGLRRPAGTVERLWRYQRERFPLATYLPLIAVFTFSAVAYSRLLRGAAGFIRPELYTLGVLTALVFFFIMRVLDEHKDAATDRRYRPELPVPRGLVTLAELRWSAVLSAAGVLLLNAMAAPVLLLACAAVALWMLLMAQDFFARPWLRARPAAYLVTHMAIMPLIDGYTTGLDWLVSGTHPRSGLGWFLVVTFLNGTVIEIGRKTRAAEDEREGVETYTQAWGLRGAPAVWLGVLASAAAVTWFAAQASGAGLLTARIISLLLVVYSLPGLGFLKSGSRRFARLMDIGSGLWIVATYLLLGAGPFLLRRG